MNATDLVTSVRQYVAQAFGLTADDASLELDSLGIIEIIVIIESGLHRKFPEDELTFSNFRTLADVDALIRRLSDDLL